MDNLTIKQLKSICRNHNIKGYSKYRKKELIECILSYNFVMDNETNEMIKNNSKRCKTTNKYKNNEAFGITCEYITCNLYNLENDLQDRIITRNIDNLTNKLTQFKKEFEEKYKQEITGFNGFKNDSVDFFCKNDKKLSMKSNFKKSGLVCPQKIGQPTKKSFINHMKSFEEFMDIDFEPTSENVKDFYMKNMKILVKKQFEHMFCCDYTTWIYGNKEGDFNYKIIEKENIEYPFTEDLFTFTQTLETWNECISLKYNNIPIASIQNHKNRDCIKFRFYINKVLGFLN